MPFVSRGRWELELAPAWSANDEEECLTIVKSDSGAFQLSSATKDHGTTSIDELTNFYAPTIPDGASIDVVEHGAFRGITTSFMDGDTHWQKYWLVNENVLIFATYNGSMSAWKRERRDIESMLNSLRFRQ